MRIGKLTLGVSKDSSVPVILQEIGPDCYVEKRVTQEGVLINSSNNLIDIQDATIIGEYALTYDYYMAINLSGIVDFHTVETVRTSGLQGTFQGTGITGVDLSSLVTVYGSNGCDNTFRNCDYLSSFIDLSSLTTINGDYGCRSMFYDCDNITGVDLSSLSSLAGQYCCGWMFFGCDKLENADLSSVSTLSPTYAFYHAFEACIKLDNVNLSSLTTITGQNACEYMFSECTSLASIDLSSLTTISGTYACQYMFNECSSLESADLSLLQTISQYGCRNMFYNCSALQEIDLSSLVEMNNAYCCTNMFSGCTDLTSVDLSSLSKITGNSAAYSMFYNCTSLEEIDLSSLRSITNGVGTTFRGCSSLETVDLSNLVDCVASFDNTFSGCTSLNSVDLSKLRGIQGNNCFYYTFYNCTSLVLNPFTAITQLYFSNGIFCNTGIIDGTFPKLSYISGADGTASIFQGCHSLEKLDFPSLIRVYGSVFKQGFIYDCDNPNFTKITFPMLTGTRYISSSNHPFGNNCFSTGTSHTIEVHFRKDAQSIIEGLPNYATLWGASAILFDLIGTITVNGEQYRREGSCNKNGYIAWKKIGSTITLDNGNSYVFDAVSVGYWTKTSDVTTLFDYPGAMYYWLKVGETSYSDSTSIRTEVLDPQIGDPAYTYSTNTNTPAYEITATNLVFIYTPDSAEPDIGDTVYSNTSGTVLGTISAVA